MHASAQRLQEYLNHELGSNIFLSRSAHENTKPRLREFIIKKYCVPNDSVELPQIRCCSKGTIYYINEMNLPRNSYENSYMANDQEALPW